MAGSSTVDGEVVNRFVRDRVVRDERGLWKHGGNGVGIRGHKGFALEGQIVNIRWTRCEVRSCGKCDICRYQRVVILF